MSTDAPALTTSPDSVVALPAPLAARVEALLDAGVLVVLLGVLTLSAGILGAFLWQLVGMQPVPVYAIQ